MVKGKLFGFIALVAFVAGAVLLFLCPSLLENSLTDAGKVGVGIAGLVGVKAALGVGAILGGIFSVLARSLRRQKLFS